MGEDMHSPRPSGLKVPLDPPQSVAVVERCLEWRAIVAWVVCRRHGLSGWQSLLAAHPRRASGQDQGKRCNGAWILAGLGCRSRAASQLGCWQCLGPCTRPRPIPVVCVHLKCNVEPPTFTLPRPQSNVVGPISSQMERNPLHHSISAHHCTYHSAPCGKRTPASGPFQVQSAAWSFLKSYLLLPASRHACSMPWPKLPLALT